MEFEQGRAFSLPPRAQRAVGRVGERSEPGWGAPPHNAPPPPTPPHHVAPLRGGRGVAAFRIAAIALLALTGATLFGQSATIHAKALLAQVLLERAFAATIATGHDTKPWPWADTWPVARIEIPRIGAHAIVLKGSSGQALAFGPGHVENTPDAGERGVAIYSAHRDTHFRFLKDVAVGDEIDVTRRDGRTFRYRVTGTSVVRFDAPGIDPLADTHEIVLSTCWPFDAVTSGPLRYLVHAEIVTQSAATTAR